MSEENNNGYKVPLTKVKEVNPHCNAERLALYTVYGFQVIGGKDSLKIGDQIVYIPVDSILKNGLLEDLLFPQGSKIKLHDHRVRAIRIRGTVSQGMLAKPEDLEPLYGKNWWVNIDAETDLSAMLDIAKYEPPFKGSSSPGKQTRDRPDENPRFRTYNGLTNIKWMPEWFKEGDEVVIQEKTHGSNARASIQPMPANTIWRKFLKLIGMLPKYQECYGSNRVQLQDKKKFKGYYGTDVYGAAFKRIDVFSKLKLGETVFCELIGNGIQKNYNYGHFNMHGLLLFDVLITDADGHQKYLDPNKVEAFAEERGFELTPVLYKGPYTKDLGEKYCTGPSVYYSGHKVREGCVIKATKDYDNLGQKKGLKVINPEYLLDCSNSDEH